MQYEDYTIRDARPDEFKAIGQLMVDVYSNLDGFPKPDEQPAYYELLANIGGITQKPKARLLVAVSRETDIEGAVVYMGDMAHYGSGGTATQEKDAAAFRLLSVAPAARGRGLGKLLSNVCIELARDEGYQQMIIHTTDAMKPAWKMYEKIGFKRSEDLDFLMEGFPVYGFRMPL
jgi:GNAT superfamily N-acetyltransferase